MLNSFVVPLKKKFFSSLRVLYLFIISTVNPFVDIIITFFARLSSLVLTSTCLVLFEVTFLFIFFSLLLKSAPF